MKFDAKVYVFNQNFVSSRIGFYWTGEGGVDEPDVCLVNLDMENVVDVVS